MITLFFIIIFKIINLYYFNAQSQFIIEGIYFLGTVFLFGFTEFMSKVIEEQKYLNRSIDIYVHNIFYYFMLSTIVVWLFIYMINVDRLEVYKESYAFFYCALSCFYIIYKFRYLYQKISKSSYKLYFSVFVRFLIVLNIFTIVGTYDYTISEDSIKIKAIDTAFSNSILNGFMMIIENGGKVFYNGFEGNGCLLIVLGTIILSNIDEMLQIRTDK